MTQRMVMYPGQHGSPQTTLSSGCQAGDTTIVVANASILLTSGSLPFLMTIGTSTGFDSSSEVVLATNIATNTLTVTRGIQGTPHVWAAGSLCAILFTEYQNRAFSTNLGIALDEAPKTEYTANMMINGNLEMWQRGTSVSNPASVTLLADKFVISYSGIGSLPTLVHSRQTCAPGDLDGTFYFYRIAPDGAGSTFNAWSFYTLQHSIRRGTRDFAGAGKYVTVSFFARSNIANKRIGLGLQSRYGTGGSPSANGWAGSCVTLTSTWTRYTVTLPTPTNVGVTYGTNNDDYMILYIFIAWDGATWGEYNLGVSGTETFGASGTIDFARFIANPGMNEYTFMPKRYDAELKSCEKSYQVMSITTINGTFWLPFRTQMYSIPTATRSGGSATFANATTDGISVVDTSAESISVLLETGD